MPQQLKGLKYPWRWIGSDVRYGHAHGGRARTTRLSRSTWPLHSRTSAGSVSPTDAPATAYASALLRPLWTPGCSDAHWTLDALAEADTVIVPGRSALTPVPAGVLDALRTAAAAGTRIASICSGTFTLAAAGLLDGLRATTHCAFPCAACQSDA